MRPPAGREALASAAFCLAALLAAPALLPRAGAVAECPRPGELAAAAGHTRAVGCRGSSGRELRGPARLLFGRRLDPNRADLRSLEVLPGIGPARARAIVAERCKRPFASAAELVRVSGIGRRTAGRLEPWLAARPVPQARCSAVH